MQAYFMGLMFFLAGLFCTASYKRKGSARYVMDRCLRLLVPLVLYNVLIVPLTYGIARGASPLPGLNETSNVFAW